MGVHGLWDLLAPVGRRVSVETLAGKKLAIDASIWMIQFMKAMRDEKGEMIRNAHLVGFFRRICKLLFLRIKPVFVFDGGTPALKRRTVIARRRQRENAQTKIRKTAEKLLLNQLKTMRLKELQEDLQNQRQKNDAKGKKVRVDDKVKGKGKVIVDEQIIREHTSEGNNLSPANYDQEALDAMLAASIAAEEGGSFAADASTSGGGIPPVEEDGDDDDEEMLLPAMHGQIDPAVLAALPPSMQLDLLVQMRERLMAENRQRYQKVKKAPARFSELQIQAYLKTVAFRREIGEVQKSAAGKGIGGVQTSRIASEANREFIFSSSFTGDKQVLTSGGKGKSATQQSQTPSADVPSNAVNDVPSITISNSTAESVQDDAGRVLPDDVETYQDERGRIRLSRGRAMGIRMTRDLQRNLDLMKEIEQDGAVMRENVNADASTDPNIGDVPGNSPNSLHTLNQNTDGISDANDNVEDYALKSGTSIEISFETNAEQKSGDDDDLFARLVAGESMMDFSIDNSLTKEQPVESDSDCEWEEGIVEGKVTSPGNDSKMKPTLDAGSICDDSGVEWEEGCSSLLEGVSPPSAEYNGPLSKGTLEEDADFQEAIRRSIEDLKDPRISDISCENLESDKRKEMVHLRTISGYLNEEKDGLDFEITARNIYQPPESPFEAPASIRKLDSPDKLNMLPVSDNSQLAPVLGGNPARTELLKENALGRCLNSSKDENEIVNLHGELHVKSDTHLREKDASLIKENPQDTSNNKIDVSMGTTVSPDISNEELRNSILSDFKQKDFEAALDGTYDVVVPRKASLKDTESNIDLSCNSSQGQGHNELLFDSGKSISALMDSKEEQVQVSEAGLEEQLLVLDEEYKQLGNEQKRLERNAESVSSEMFAECQELLQMFGLPYIVAPMEAEAQCAFMELVNVVDGVVTDDSDAFLFGARSVFKNIFDERKYVETYFMKDIENELGLDREKLIRMALLLGSDYTEGVSGIGIVNAVEVISAFPEEDGLRKFREWIESPDPAILGKFDAREGCGSSKRGPKVGDIDKDGKQGGTASDQGVSQSDDEIQKIKQIFMEEHRNVSKNWHIPSTFPSDAVTSAYASPQVDKSTEPFAWGKPDLFALRKMCWEKFGWGNKKSDEVLLPVLKEYDKHETQLRLEAFYTFNEKFAKIRSKRIKSTIKGIKGNTSLEQMDDSLGDVPKTRKKRKANPSEADRSEAEKSSSVVEPGDVGENINKMSSKKESNKRKRQAEVEGSNSKPAREATIRGKGRERSLSTRQRKRTKSCLKNDETSSDDELNREREEVAEVVFVEPHQVRRSERTRKEVNYSMNDGDIDDPNEAEERDRDSTRDVTTKETPADQAVVGACSSGGNGKYKSEPGDLGQEYVGDFLDIGGEISDEGTKPNMGIGQLNFDQSDISLNEAQLSKEYLSMGGGFCLDDDEADENSERCPSSPNQTTTSADVDLSNFAVPAEEKNQESDSIQLLSNPTSRLNEQSKARPDASETKENASGFTCSQEDIVNDDLKIDFPRPLRAMPNLRKRRKK